ncbi:hypothetical protein yc1106_05659 [Curvularia clavata]|uniref:Rhodopsin domain-containing protein n=1 Tax=Curvularia clavata TaxID=95742 RepID=A0A9Q9DTV3_CURCL|nr:hypothetical protein yc1106_05659 [Curvularia clavata]
MAGKISPIAALTADDLGPINTIVAIVLPVTSALIATVRMTTRKRMLIKFEADDAMFGFALFFGMITSILSHICVRAGLGRHQMTLSKEKLGIYFKYFWTTQILGVIALAFAKLSLVLLFKRIAPTHIKPLTFRWLLFMVTAYVVACLFMIAFQCQMPQPWILRPDICSTHGAVYYATTVLDIVTDAALALWVFPIIWLLNMNSHTKWVVLSVFGSRLLVCLADVVRIIMIRRALQSEDQTRSQLLWAIMDQIVVHLSINHATLPRIQNFLSHLQVGPLIPETTVAQSASDRSKGGSRSNNSKYAKLSQNDANKSGPNIGRQLSHRWSTLYAGLNKGLGKEPSISEQPLRSERHEEIELSTMVYVGEDVHREGKVHRGQSAAISLSSDGANQDTATLGVVRVRKDIQVTYE